MENFDLLNNDLQVSPASQTFFSEAARWGKFISIIGFVFCGLMIIIAFFIPTLMLSVPPYNQIGSMIPGMATGITVLYLLLSLLFFFPCLYLYKFSIKMKLALSAANQENFEKSLQNLKSLLKFYGILFIILLSFYALIFIIAMLSVAMKG